jgi:hypothetical protein
MRDSLNDEFFDDELNDDDLEAIQESERQIAQGQARDFKEVATELRRKYLRE